MADPLSMAAGIVGVTAFALQSSKALCDAIEAARGSSRSIRELKTETDALSGVLSSLEETLAVSGTDFTALRMPLQQCGQLCQDYAAILTRCSAHTSGDKFSWRDFLKATYKDKDLADLRSLIGAYKSTITIALADANIRQVSVTAKVLQEYKQMIEETTADLQELLQRSAPISPEVSQVNKSGIQSSEVESSGLGDERSSIEACLAICAKVSEHIDQVQAELFLNRQDGLKPGRATVIDQSTPAVQITTQRLENWKTEVDLTSAELRIRLQELDARISKLSQHTNNDRTAATSREDESEIHQEVESLKTCLNVIEEATEQVKGHRINVYEDNKVADRGHQVVVSTIGDLITAKRFEGGLDSMQIFGQMSDVSYQHTLNLIDARRGYTMADPSTSRSKDGDRVSVETVGSQFRGAGRKL